MEIVLSVTDGFCGERIGCTYEFTFQTLQGKGECAAFHRANGSAIFTDTSHRQTICTPEQHNLILLAINQTMVAGGAAFPKYEGTSHGRTLFAAINHLIAEQVPAEIENMHLLVVFQNGKIRAGATCLNERRKTAHGERGKEDFPGADGAVMGTIVQNHMIFSQSPPQKRHSRQRQKMVDLIRRLPLSFLEQGVF